METLLTPKLNLTKVEAYRIWASDNDKGSNQTVRGLYKNKSIAIDKSKKIGFFGSDGTVETMYNIYKNDDGSLFEVKSLGKYTDEEIAHNEKIIEAIHSKLNAEEIEYIKNHKL